MYSVVRLWETQDSVIRLGSLKRVRPIQSHKNFLHMQSLLKPPKPLLLPAPLSAYGKVLATLTPDFWDQRLQFDKQGVLPLPDDHS